MKILDESEMAARLDFASPLRPAPDPPESVWCIPFEYGGLPKGTRISIAKAREISAELRAAVAEADARMIRREFEKERARADASQNELGKAQLERHDLQRQIAELKASLRLKAKGGR